MKKFTSPAQQAINLIRYIGDQVSETGQPLDRLFGISGIMNSPSEELASQIARELRGRKLVEIDQLVETVDGTLLINANLTLDGWERYEAEKRGGLTGATVFSPCSSEIRILTLS